MDKEETANYYGEEGEKYEEVFLIVSCIAALFFTISLSTIRSEETQWLCFACEDGGVVDKTQCEAFTVKITFKTLENARVRGL